MPRFNYPLFFLGFILMTGLAATVIPGLDILAWYLLQPHGFWQRIILIGIELLSTWARLVLAFFIWGVGMNIFNEICK